MKKILSLCIGSILILTACTPKVQEASFDYFNFDTSINVKFNYTNRDKLDLTEIETDIQGILDDLETTFSRTLEGTMLYELNENKTAEVSDEFIEVIEEANVFCNQVDGRYDYSSGKLIELWSINNKDYLPSSKEVEALLPAIDCNDVKIDGNTVTINEDVDLDFGSIVKGYAADLIDEYLTDKGIQSGLLNLGGNIQTIGSKPDGSDYRIGIQAPEIENLTSSDCAIMDVSDKAVVTSGINQRFFVEDGKIYHHILDANDGYPVDNGLASVSIITDRGIDADGLSTTAFILGLDEGMDLINSLDGVEAFFITKDKEIYQSDNAPTLEVIDEDYKLMN